MTRVLFDVSHPAHVHLFRNAIGVLDGEGHDVAVASREKDVTTDLLDAYGIDHAPLTTKGTGTLGLAREWLLREGRLLRYARRFDPDVVVSRLNPAAAHVSRLLGVPNVVFHDTEAAGTLSRVTCPFAHTVCTPASFQGDVPGRQVRYQGYHELAYLHPARFTPDPAPLCAAGVDPEEPYSIVRLVGMDAHHDVGSEGISEDGERELLDTLTERGEVYVTSERPVSEDLDARRAPVDPADMHHLLAFADLFVGDSSTMATESALLGTPTVRLNTFDEEPSNFEDLAEYGLVVSTPDEREVLDAVADLANDPDAGVRWRRRRRNLLAEKIDVTAFMLELIREVGAAAP